MTTPHLLVLPGKGRANWTKGYPAAALPPPRRKRILAHRSGGKRVFLEGLAYAGIVVVLLAAGYLQAGGL